MGTPTRTITVEGTTFQWRRSSRQRREPAQWVETVTVWTGQGRLLLRFPEGDGGGVRVGGWGGHAGCVTVGERGYNLNRPAVVAALVRAALARGWRPDAGQRRVEDPAFVLLIEGGAPSEEG